MAPPAPHPRRDPGLHASGWVVGQVSSQVTRSRWEQGDARVAKPQTWLAAP